MAIIIIYVFSLCHYVRQELSPRNQLSTRCVGGWVNKKRTFEAKSGKRISQRLFWRRERIVVCCSPPRAFALMWRSCLEISANCPLMAVVHCVCKATQGKRELQEKTNKPKKKKKVSWTVGSWTKGSQRFFTSNLNTSPLGETADPHSSSHSHSRGDSSGSNNCTECDLKYFDSPTTPVCVMSVAQGKVKLRPEQAL